MSEGYEYMGGLFASGAVCSDWKVIDLTCIHTKDTRRVNTLCLKWHSRLPIYKAPHGIRTDYILLEPKSELIVGVASWTVPIARAYNNKGMYELRRMALAPYAKPNCASRFLSLMTKDIRVRVANINRLISYQDTTVHVGTIYKAANWQPLAIHSRTGKGWESRADHNQTNRTDKQIWIYDL